MQEALTPYLLTLFLSVSISWFLAFYSWRRRQKNASAFFAALMVAAGFWALFYGLQLLTPSLDGKLLWFNFKQLGASVLGPLILLFTLQYTSRRIANPRLLYGLLLIEPIASQIVFWSNRWHGFAGSPSLVTDVLPFPLLNFEFGPWYWISIFVGYLLLTLSIFILVSHLSKATPVFRRQTGLILLGLITPWLAGILSLVGMGRLELFDVTAFLFPVSGLLMVVGLVRHPFLSLMPVAYPAVFSSLKDGIIIVDNKFKILELNPAALQLLGRRESELIGTHISEVFPDWPGQNFQHPNVDNSQISEFYYEGGGQYRYLEVHGASLDGTEHPASGYAFILYDVTERKLAETARQLTEDRYRTIFETESAATVIVQENMTISLANDRFVSLSGYPRKKIEGEKKWTEFVHQDDLERVLEHHQAEPKSRRQKPIEYEFRFVNHLGQLKNVHASVVTMPDSTANLVSLLDITERKAAEQLLEQRATNLEAAIRSEQERSAIILQNIKDAIAVSDLDIKTIYVNKAFSSLTGYSPDEVMGKSPKFLLYGRVPQQIWTSLQHAIIDQTIWEGELKLRRKNGTFYDAAVLIAPMRDGQGRLIGYVSSHRDITQAKRMEESRRNFVTNISHQLRTPVTNLKLYIDLLQRHFDTSRKEKYFATLNDQIERLEIIIRSTLEIVSLEETEKKLEWEPIQWDMVSESLQIRLQQKAADKNIHLNFSPNLAQLPVIIGDSQRIFQAVYELIHNAISFTPPGGHIAINGGVLLENSPPWLTISVCDDGPGIAPSEQGRIFDRFYRGKQAEAGQVPGTGLGLSMVMLIAQAHNGRVTVESNLGQGSTFTLWLPLD